MTSIDKYIYARSLQAITSDGQLTDKDKCQAVFLVFSQVVEELSAQVEIHFTTLFARCAYIGNHYNLSRDAKFYIQSYRRMNEQGVKDKTRYASLLKSGVVLIDFLEHILLDEPIEFHLPKDLQKLFNRDKFDVKRFVPFIRGLLVRADQDEKRLYIVTEEEPDVELAVLYDIADKNEIFTPIIDASIKHIPLPFAINLLSVEFIEDRRCLAKAFVIDPDFLIDVTSIASTFVQKGIESRLSFLNKFRDVDTTSHYILLGNLANYFFDALLSNPELKFSDTLAEVFKYNPLIMAGYDDEQVKDVIDQCSRHFHNIKEIIKHQFKELNISATNIYLEPTFYSMTYGIQGRLDLLHHDVDNGRFDIVELKSGKPFQPNVYGLSMSHYIQTLMYDLLIRSSFGFGLKPKNYVLYSKLSDGLKYAPSIESQQFEAIKARNELLLLDFMAARDAASARIIIESLIPENYEHIKGYLADNLQQHKNVLKRLRPYERAYLYEFTSFILREQRLSKVGENGVYRDNGLASLWLESDIEKENRFTLLKGLKIYNNEASEQVPTITLERTEKTSELANFRVGDLVVLYPYEMDVRSVLNNQVFKCTLIEISQDYVSVKLRASQFNNRIFEEHKYWSLESDRLDSGFNSAYRSIYKFLKQPQHIRDLLLGVSAPSKPEYTQVQHKSYLTKHQNDIVQKIISATDYYLLWGPPGTGKTSVIIRRLAEYFYEESHEVILYVAYTNRAVDEICAALEHTKDVDYVRIGSSHSTGVEFRHKLLQKKIEGFTSRKEINELLSKTRIVVGTISSMLGKMELFKLIKIHRIVVDEASQILEPMIVSLLSEVDRFVLIGDHKQLPAVVTQDATKCVVEDDRLKELGIVDLSMSLFERLYHQCQENSWEHAYGILSQQGRMHQALMAFTNESFYDGKLELIPSIERLIFQKTGERCALNCRIGFISTISENNVNWKTNYNEALQIVHLIKEILAWRTQKQLETNEETIGIIAPYRAQIALIKKELANLDKDLVDTISVDTVERYQGSARDIIIFSLCTNNIKQFESLVSYSVEGVDRKLNVATTRAREQLFIVGNRELLEQNDTYAQLISLAKAIEFN